VYTKYITRQRTIALKNAETLAPSAWFLNPYWIFDSQPDVYDILNDRSDVYDILNDRSDVYDILNDR